VGLPVPVDPVAPGTAEGRTALARAGWCFSPAVGRERRYEAARDLLSCRFWRFDDWLFDVLYNNEKENPVSTFSESNMLAPFRGGPGEVAAMLWRDPQVRTVLLALACVAVAAIAVGVARRGLHGRERAHWRDGSRYVEIAAPGAVDEAGGAVFWDHLAAVARPAWRRFWFGQPHLIWEIRVAARVMTVRVWVPSCIDTALVEAAIEAAWPGAAPTTVAAAPPLTVGPLMSGGRLSWRKDAERPVATERAGIDRLRALLYVAGDMAANACAVVQVAARPASARRGRTAGAAARPSPRTRPANC
jgi:hypothetical protein